MSPTKKRPNTKAAEDPKATRQALLHHHAHRASLIRENTEGLIEAVIRPAAEALGYAALAAHELDNPG